MHPVFLPPDTGLRTWTTEQVRSSERLDYWVGAICEAFLEMDCSSRVAHCFDGDLTHVPLTQLSVNRVHASTQDVYRTPAAISRSDSQPFYLITQTEQPWYARQGGHVVQLRPGDAVLVDAGQVYELHFPKEVSCLSVQMPRSWVGEWLRCVDVKTPRVVHRDQGWGAMLSALCVQLGRQPELALQTSPQWLENQFGALLGAALEPGATSSQSQKNSLFTQALVRMAERLDRPGWCVNDLATELGVSVRTLQRAFIESGDTVVARWRRMRMERARRLLSATRLGGLSVADIALRCGYTDASHFVRDFQREVGQTPLRWLRQQKKQH